MHHIVRESDLPWSQGSSSVVDGKKRVTHFKHLSTLEPGPQMLLVEFDPDMRVERHSHGANHQLYVMAGELSVGGEWVGPGTCISIEADSVYGPETAGPQGCRCLLVFSEPASVTYEDPAQARLPSSQA